MADNRTDIPPVDSPNFLAKVREALSTYLGNRGDPLNRGVTIGDLLDSGIVSLRSGYGASGGTSSPIAGAGSAFDSFGTPEPDLTPPPSPTGFSVTAGLTQIYVKCDNPIYPSGHGHQTSRLYGSHSVTTFANATLLAEFTGNVYNYATPTNTTWYMWLTWVSADGVESLAPAGGLNGLAATTGKIGTTDLNDLLITSAKLANGSVTATQLAANAVDATKFASGIEPVTIVTSIPGTKSTSSIFNTTDGKMYRWNGSSYVSTVPTTDLSGTIADAQIAGMAASKVTGQLTDSQLAAIAASKLTGQITSTQITDNSITTAKIAANAVTASQIAADTITAAQIAAGAVTSSELAAGAVVAGKIAAGTIQAADIAAGTITGDRLAANTITASQIAGSTITAGQIAAGAIGASQIAAGAITTNKLVVTSTQYLNADPYLKDSTVWGTVDGPGSVTLTTVSDAPMGTAILRSQSTVPTYLKDLLFYPIDTTKTYRVRFWCRSVGANGILYQDLQQYTDNAGTTCATNGGRAPYKPSGVSVSGTWTEYSNQWGPGDWQTGVKFVRLDWLLNYSGNTGYMEVCNPRFEEMATSELIVDGAVTATKIAANAIAVGTAAIQNGAIVNAMIGTATIDYTKIASVDATKITVNTLTGSQIAASTITGSNIAANTITAGNIAANTITASQIAANTITASQIASNTITASQIAASTITTDRIIVGAVSSSTSTTSVNQTLYSGAAVYQLGTNGVTNSGMSITSTGRPLLVTINGSAWVTTNPRATEFDFRCFGSLRVGGTQVALIDGYWRTVAVPSFAAGVTSYTTYAPVIVLGYVTGLSSGTTYTLYVGVDALTVDVNGSLSTCITSSGVNYTASFLEIRV